MLTATRVAVSSKWSGASGSAAKPLRGLSRWMLAAWMNFVSEAAARRLAPARNLAFELGDQLVQHRIGNVGGHDGPHAGWRGKAHDLTAMVIADHFSLVLGHLHLLCDQRGGIGHADQG